MPTLAPGSSLFNCQDSVTFDDLVPSGSGVFDAPQNECHATESVVARALQHHPELRVERLVVHRIPDGLCLEGVVTTDSNVDITAIVREVVDAERILNRVRVCRSC